MNKFTDYIIDPFLHSCKQFYERNAFCINNRFYTYGELFLLINNIRSYIRNKKINQETIGLVVNDDIETYASIFAIWMENKAYVPLHPNQPKERNQEIINQTDLSLILDSQMSKLFNTSPDCDEEVNTSESFIELRKIKDESLAYILFTSGSTGKPKGVPITKGNIGTFMKAFWSVGFSIDQEDKCLQCFDLTFDVSVQSFLVPLTRGACTYTIPHDQIKYSFVYGLFEDHQLTFGAMAPSMIRYLRPYFNEINLPSLRYNILTAEASPIDLLDEWAKCIPNARIYNFYGPTEATIYCTFFEYTREISNKNFNGLLSIGKAMNGMNAIILDEEGHILSKGKKGQLCIAGEQLTNGYWGNTEKTIDSFIRLHLFGRDTRFYKTGDLCFMDEDEDIMYAGRLDYQVKIQGYRIELGEIEFHVREFLSGCSAVAIPLSGGINETEIVLFIEKKKINEPEILQYLKSKVPAYMIPAKLYCREQFPLNTNGKIDRNKLKASIQ